MKKVLKYILLGLVLAFGIYVLVSFIINKDGTMYWINYVIDLMNKPLPIVGVTAAAVLIFIWKLVITTNYGKSKLAQYKAEAEELKNEFNLFVKDVNNIIVDLEEENNKLRNQLSNACQLSTNKKIKDFGKGLNNGKETINCDSEEE